MEITKVLKPFIRRGANTFGNIVYEAEWTETDLRWEEPDPCNERFLFLHHSSPVCPRRPPTPPEPSSDDDDDDDDLY